MEEFTGFKPSQVQDKRDVEIANLKQELQNPEIPQERKGEICNILNEKHGIPSIQFGDSVFCKDGKYTGASAEHKSNDYKHKYDYSQKNMDKVIGMIQECKSLQEVSKEVKIPPQVLSVQLWRMGLSYTKIREEAQIKQIDKNLMVDRLPKKKSNVGRECKHDWSQPNIDKIVAMIKDGKKMSEISKEVKIPLSQISGKLTVLGLNKRKLLEKGEIKESIGQRVIKEVKGAKIDWIEFMNWLKKHFGYDSCAAIHEYDINVIRLYIENAKKTQGKIPVKKQEDKKMATMKYDWSPENIARIQELLKTKKLKDVSEIVKIPGSSISLRFSKLGLTEKKWQRKPRRKIFTEEEKAQAIAMKEEGKGYEEIGAVWGLSYDVMWGNFREWGLTGSKKKSSKVKVNETLEDKINRKLDESGIDKHKFMDWLYKIYGYQSIQLIQEQNVHTVLQYIKQTKRDGKHIVPLSLETEKLIEGAKSATCKIVEREENIPVGDGRDVIVKVNVTECGTQILIHIPLLQERRDK